MKKLNVIAVAALSCVVFACGNGGNKGTLNEIVSEEQLDSAANAATQEALNNPEQVTEGAPQNAEAEGLLAKYTLLIEQYEQFAEKANTANQAELAQKATELASQINSTQKEIGKMTGTLSDKELTALSQLSRRFTDAADKVQAALTATRVSVKPSENN